MLNPGLWQWWLCAEQCRRGRIFANITQTCTNTLTLAQRSRGVLEGEILANQRRWIEENMEKRSGREADSY